MRLDRGILIGSLDGKLNAFKSIDSRIFGDKTLIDFDGQNHDESTDI